MTTTAFELLREHVARGELLHGSPEKLDTLHGKPLYATDRVFMAILYAVLPRTKKFTAVRFHVSGLIRAPAKVIKSMKPGYVHVVPGDLFTEFKGDNKIANSSAKLGGEFISYEAVSPLAIIEVCPDDLPIPPEERPNSEFNDLKSTFVQTTTHKRGFRTRFKCE